MGNTKLSTSDVAERLHVSPKCVEKWRRRGTGPPFHKNGRSVYYLAEDLRHWREVCNDLANGLDDCSHERFHSYQERLNDGFRLMHASEYD